MIRRRNRHDVTVKRNHVLTEAYDTGIARHEFRSFRVRVSAAEGQPPRTVVVDDDTRVERCTAKAESGCAAGNEVFAERVGPWPQRRSRGNDAYASSAIGEI